MNGDFLKAGFQAIRVMDPSNQTITTVGYTDRGRWYPTVMTLADGNILVVGGVQMVRATLILYCYFFVFTMIIISALCNSIVQRRGLLVMLSKHLDLLYTLLLSPLKLIL